MVRGGEGARARGKRRPRLLLGLLLPPFAGLILLRERRARRPLGRLPPHSSGEPSRPGLATPAPHSAPPRGRCRVRAEPEGGRS